MPKKYVENPPTQKKVFGIVIIILIKPLCEPSDADPRFRPNRRAVQKLPKNQYYFFLQSCDVFRSLYLRVPFNVCAFGSKKARGSPADVEKFDFFESSDSLFFRDLIVNQGRQIEKSYWKKNKSSDFKASSSSAWATSGSSAT